MKQKTFAFITMLSLMAVALPVHGEEVEVRAGVGANLAPLEIHPNVMPIKTSTTTERLRMNAELEARRRASTTLRMEDQKARMSSTTERREEMKAQIEMKRASSTARRVEMQQGIAKKRAEHAGKVLLATIERLEKILVRVESRIAKVKANGGATAESEANIVDAKVHLQAARVNLEAFASIDLSAEKANENFDRIKEAAEEVKIDLKLAHESLVKAIRSLKPGRLNGSATTTTPVSTTTTSTTN